LQEVYFNQVAERYADVTSEQIQGKTPEKAFGKELGATIRQNYNCCLQAGTSIHYEEQLAFEGHTIWTLTTLSPIRNEQGRIYRIVGTAVDISDRKLIEAQLRESEEKFRILVTHAPVGIFQTDPQGDCLFVNHKWSELTGLSLDRAMGKGWLDAIHSEDRERVFQEWYDAAQAKREFFLEYRFQTPQGKVNWVVGSAVAIRNRDGVVTGYFGTVTDISDRKAADEALQQSEARFRELAEIIDEVFYITSPGATQILYISPAYEKIWGRTCESLYQKPHSWLEAIHPDDRDRILSAFVKQLQGGRLQEEYRIIRPDGELRWISDRNFHIYDEAGQVLRYVGVATDITERKLAEIGLREMSSALSNAVEGISQLDCQGRYLMVNQAYASAVGYQPEEMVGMEWQRTVHPEDIEMMMAAYQQMLSAGKVETEARGIRKDGSIFYKQLNMIAIYNDRGQSSGHYCFMKDISDRKRAEQKIREQAALLDIASDAIFVRDLEHQILFWNSGAEQLYGWTTAEVIDKKANELLCQKIRPEMEQIFKTVLESGFWQGELQKVTKSGKEVIVNSRMTLVRDEAGNPKSILTVDTDITEKKQLEKQFYQAQRLESLGTLASGIAHDLNNILTPILAVAQLLPIKLPNLERQNRRLLEILTDNAKRGAELVKQILSFARGEEEEKVLLQPKYAIEETERIIKVTFPKLIAIHTNIPKQNLGTISANPTQIAQVLMNLCVNARDAMPNGGTLTIAVENFSVDENYARMNLAAKVGNYVAITVSDTGCGIPEAIKERIFDPFFTTKEVGKGTGLGLATAIGIVKKHGGFVNVKSEVGKGSQFQVCLPASDTAATQVDSE
jgi:PAS domain S-box-containing protein